MKTSQKIWAAVCALGYLTLAGYTHVVWTRLGCCAMSLFLAWAMYGVMTLSVWLVVNECLKDKEDQQ